MWYRDPREALAFLIVSLPFICIALLCHKFLPGLWYPRSYADLLRVGLWGVLFLLAALALFISEIRLFPAHCCKARHHWNQRSQPRVHGIVILWLCIGAWLTLAALFPVLPSSHHQFTPVDNSDWRTEWYFANAFSLTCLALVGFSKQIRNRWMRRWLFGERKQEPKQRRRH